MKNIILSEAELSWLVELLKERLVFFSSGNIPNKRRHKDTLLALDIVSSGSEGLTLKLDLKRVIYSCINGRLSVLFKQIAGVTQNVNLYGPNIKNAFATIDMGLDVLTKFGYQRLKYHQKYDFGTRYSDRIPAYEFTN